ncbi:MAG: ERCC4 domain-containing protein [Nanoarchaeota archaeon]
MKEIFNIFSRKKFPEKEKEKPKIVVDYREKNSLIIPELISLGFDVEVKELKVADYLVKGTAIERKTVSDFISSMKNRRLLKQLEELQQYESRLLIIEGIEEQEIYSEDFSEKGFGMHPNSVRGFLLSVLLNYRVPIIFTKNHEDTAKFISVLAKKETRESPLNATKKVRSIEEQAQYIIEGFPGIGPKTAKKLLKKFRTIKNVINASAEDLKKEIGKKADNILRIIEQKHY